MDQSFCILGTSSGLPVADKATSGYLFKNGKSLTVLDCGGGVTQSFLRRGYNPVHIDRIFISHTHSDHVCELPLLIQLIYLSKRTEPIDIYLPEEFIQPFRNYLQALYLIEEKLPFTINFIAITESSIYNDTNIEIQTIQNDHLQKYTDTINELQLPNRMQSFSFLLKMPKAQLLYSSDLASIQPIKKYLSGLDYLLIDSTHIDISELLDLESSHSISQIILTHLSSSNQIEESINSALKRGIKNVIVALDGMEIQL